MTNLSKQEKRDLFFQGVLWTLAVGYVLVRMGRI